MARGWESKSVETQQDLIADRPKLKRVELTAAQMALETRCDSLELQRTRVLRDLETCKNDRVRKTLEDGLAFLQAELASLKGE